MSTLPSADLPPRRLDSLHVAERSTVESDPVREIAHAVFRRWPVIVGAAALAALIVGVRSWLQPRSYTSIGSFVLQGGRAAPSLSGIASQFGISLPNAEAGPSAALYVDVLQSRTVLSAVAREPYCDPCAPGVGPSVPLTRILGIHEPDTGATMEAVLRRLRTMVVGGVNPKTGIVTVSASASSAALAQQLAQHALDALTQFNLATRQSQAGAERRFTENRVREIRGELGDAEQRLKDFRQSNRFAAAPELQLREGQLEREVRRYEEVYSALARALEQSKIDEVRDTPAITLIDAPGLPYSPNPRGVAMKAAFAGLVGAAAAVALLIGLSIRRRRT